MDDCWADDPSPAVTATVPDLAIGSRRLPWRRIGAFAIDWCLAAAYVGALTAIIFTTGFVRLESPDTTADRVAGQLLAFAVLTGPVILYFSLMEASHWQATIGKRLLGVRVVGPADARLTVARSLARSALKFLPWEVAHTAIWHSSDRPFLDEPSPLTLTVMLAAQVVALWFAGALFVGTGRTPYDRVVQTRVVR
jgi:uncharacterized RDD family membrane protein YckC